MTIRIALLAAACLGVAGCTPSANLGGVMSSMRADEPPPRTCRNVTADVVLISSRASAAAGLVAQEPRLGAGGVTEVAWPMQGVAGNQIVVDLMARMKTESELIGCPISFQESLPPSQAAIAVVPTPVPEAVSPPAPRSAWNAPGTPAAHAAMPPAATPASAPAVPAANPALTKVAPAAPGPAKAALAPAKPPSTPVERTSPAASAAVAPAAPPVPAAKTTKAAAVDQAPRRSVRVIPTSPAPTPEPTP